MYFVNGTRPLAFHSNSSSLVVSYHPEPLTGNTLFFPNWTPVKGIVSISLLSPPRLATALTRPGRCVYQEQMVLILVETPPAVVCCFRQSCHQQQCCLGYSSCQPCLLGEIICSPVYGTYKYEHLASLSSCSRPKRLCWNTCYYFSFTSQLGHY